MFSITNSAKSNPQQWEDSGAVLLPYLFLERTLDITEGTIDYWLPPENWETLQIEGKDESSLTEHDFNALAIEGKYLDAAWARFRFIITPCSRRHTMGSHSLSLPTSDTSRPAREIWQRT